VAAGRPAKPTKAAPFMLRDIISRRFIMAVGGWQLAVGSWQLAES